MQPKYRSRFRKENLEQFNPLGKTQTIVIANVWEILFCCCAVRRILLEISLCWRHC